MTVSKAQLAEVKAYMRIDGDADDAVIKVMYKAAVRYLENAGIKEPLEDPALYKLAVWGLTLNYYDHRDSVGNEASFPIGLRPVINQLKLMGDVARGVSQ